MSAKEDISALTVSQLTEKIKVALEGGFSRIYVEGEVSGFKLYPSGHAYFTLKDAGAQIPAVMFASNYQACLAKHPGIGDAFRSGAKLLVYGSVSVYAPRGAYQLVVYAARLVGGGELMQRYLELKAKLEAEGLFAPQRKRPLPIMPRRIGIVTSPAGAVIHDMCEVLLRRFPNLEIRLFPAAVQGADAPRALIAGLSYFNADSSVRGGWTPDLVIVARGGGSFEDLFCFNDESLVRAVADSHVPVISAVGHETDFTLCDFAADVRAGTPSIAAETAVPVMDEIIRRIERSREQMALALRSRGEWFAQRVDQLSDAIAGALSVASERAGTRLARASSRLRPAIALAEMRARSRLDTAREKLQLLSPYGVLERGYTLTLNATGSVVRSSAALKAGDRIVTRWHDGSTGATVTEVISNSTNNK